MKNLPKDILKAHIERSVETKEKLLEFCADDVEKAATMLLSHLREGGKILACGNGGSAVTAQRFATELVGGKSRAMPSSERKPLPIVAISSSSSVLTAIGNNFGFERVFSRQVDALGKKGDILLAITTSGNSQNVVGAAQSAHAKEMLVIGLTGESGGGLVPHCDVCVRVPSSDPYTIQEAHMAIIAVWSLFLESNSG